MKYFEFKPEDFRGLHDNYVEPGMAYCKRANELLEEYLKILSVVKYDIMNDTYSGYPMAGHNRQEFALWPLPLKPCEHQPTANVISNSVDLGEVKCKFCNAKLKITWTA
jgi:hypothetical protein